MEDVVVGCIEAEDRAAPSRCLEARLARLLVGQEASVRVIGQTFVFIVPQAVGESRAGDSGTGDGGAEGQRPEPPRGRRRRLLGRIRGRCLGPPRGEEEKACCYDDGAEPGPPSPEVNVFGQSEVVEAAGFGQEAPRGRLQNKQQAEGCGADREKNPPPKQRRLPARGLEQRGQSHRLFFLVKTLSGRRFLLASTKAHSSGSRTAVKS